eukprot:CAMPEP_0178397152 /NCGR_PEP_ID=MMETSP0689_2-20121128/14097_1 /TAXON_ID=160604 /ORGANISM="Amphidinium massartii, Strain CS-259" /LENGTH=55 /DNA_ID=CAMNT_0020017849 /DNA_START=11 /DNA_END=175 /DNA_ORIENTATION=+
MKRCPLRMLMGLSLRRCVLETQPERHRRLVTCNPRDCVYKIEDLNSSSSCEVEQE